MYVWVYVLKQREAKLEEMNFLHWCDLSADLEHWIEGCNISHSIYV